eukprot:354786-Chlamydomonas_euryale.AAC.2
MRAHRPKKLGGSSAYVLAHEPDELRAWTLAPTPESLPSRKVFAEFELRAHCLRIPPVQLCTRTSPYMASQVPVACCPAGNSADQKASIGVLRPLSDVRATASSRVALRRDSTRQPPAGPCAALRMPELDI